MPVQSRKAPSGRPTLVSPSTLGASFTPADGDTSGCSSSDGILTATGTGQKLLPLSLPVGRVSALRVAHNLQAGGTAKLQRRRFVAGSAAPSWEVIATVNLPALGAGAPVSITEVPAVGDVSKDDAWAVLLGFGGSGGSVFSVYVESVT